jgi:tripartite-type tricarboxylate transporter receptor subunit TctC
LVTAFVAALLFSLAGGNAGSQTNRTIKIVVAVPPGGNTDIVARVLADQIGRAHGPAMVIENRPGAGSAIATEAVARAAPDGNTLLIAGNSFVVNPHLRKVNYDPLASCTRQARRIDPGERWSRKRCAYRDRNTQTRG